MPLDSGSSFGGIHIGDRVRGKQLQGRLSAWETERQDAFRDPAARRQDAWGDVRFFRGKLLITSLSRIRRTNVVQGPACIEAARTWWARSTNCRDTSDFVARWYQCVVPAALFANHSVKTVPETTSLRFNTPTTPLLVQRPPVNRIKLPSLTWRSTPWAKSPLSRSSTDLLPNRRRNKAERLVSCKRWGAKIVHTLPWEPPPLPVPLVGSAA